jgi:hypothetical protein
MNADQQDISLPYGNGVTVVLTSNLRPAVGARWLERPVFAIHAQRRNASARFTCDD